MDIRGSSYRRLPFFSAWTLTTVVGLAVSSPDAGSFASAPPPTFFPNAVRVYVPRGTAQLLKPYLPKPEGRTRNYRLVIETPDFLKYVTVEKAQGNPPFQVRESPGQTRGGVKYLRQTLTYEAYPTSGFELSLCWQDSLKRTLEYRPAIALGGTFDWSHWQQTVTVPAGAAYVRLLIIKWQNRGITGTFWVDNVVFRAPGNPKNLLPSGTFDEPAWKSCLVKPEGKNGSRCAKFVCTPEQAQKQQALWLDPERQDIPVKPGENCVVELDLKAEKLGPPVAEYIAALLYRAEENAPEGRSQIFTRYLGSDGKTGPERSTDLVILPPLKNVRPKSVRIAPCLYATSFEPAVAEAYAKNSWESGMTWSYGSRCNNVVSQLWSRGQRVWLTVPAEPFAAYGATEAFRKAHPEAGAIASDGKPRSDLFCPTWLLSPAGAEIRTTLEKELIQQVDHDGYTAVNWDIEQPVILAETGVAPRSFCLCQRCLAAFRQQQKIDPSEQLDSHALLTTHRSAWVAFRCRQNADLAGHVARALKSCARPVEFSVYSGYQGQQTREHYGVDWQLLSPHLDLAIAGYGGTRQACLDTLQALGKVPLIGGENYFLSPTPISAGEGWIASSMKQQPRPELWRNRLLRQFVDSGCNGVLIWYLLTMDGGTFYHTSEAAEIIAVYEEIFRQGRRCDSDLRVGGIKPDAWAAFSHRGKRLLLLLNSSGQEATVRVEQPAVPARWEARLHGKPQPLKIDPASFSMTIEPYGVRVITFTRP